MSFLTVFALANFLYVFLAWIISWIFVIVVLLLAPFIAVVVIAVLVAMVHFAISLDVFNFFIFFFNMLLHASIISKSSLATFTVTESSSLLALDSCAEPRAPVEALFTKGANECLLALAFCFVSPEV